MNRRQIIKNTLFISPILIGFNTSLFSKIFQENEGNNLFDILINKAEKHNWYKYNFNELIITVAKNFIGIPYISGTLDNENFETCVINLNGLDCVTFFENSLALARIIKKRKFTYQDFLDEVEFTRYRDGKLDGYTSRLHYTSEWIINNIKKNVVIDKTELIGGQEFHPNVFFMSKYPEKYKQLKNNPDLVVKIKKIEDEINVKTLYYLPTNEILNNDELIESGDILALVTTISGLDYSHTGIAYRDENNDLRFFHASSLKKEVLIDINLSNYMLNKKKDIGITVLKAIEPKV